LKQSIKSWSRTLLVQQESHDGPVLPQGWPPI